MLRVLIFGFACVVVLVGLATALPVVEEGIQIGQFASSLPPYAGEAVSLPPSCNISANPRVISKGDTASIAWESRDADTAYLAPSFGEVPLEGGIFIEPERSDVYTLYVSSALGQAACSTYITVE